MRGNANRPVRAAAALLRRGCFGVPTAALERVMLGLCLAVFLAAVTPAAAETRIALVIGNANYTANTLKNPRRDAGLMSRTLASVGFDVMTLMDASAAQMRTAITEFGRRLKAPGTVALFYFAGHGVQAAGENFLIPRELDAGSMADVVEKGVALSDIFKTMERTDPRLNIVLLDACRDNPFAAAPGYRATDGLAPVVAPGGTIIGYATAPGNVAFDGNGENSPYTEALAAVIPTAGATLEEVFRAARRRVLTITLNKQLPWEHSSLVTEFYFKSAPEPIVTGALPDSPPDARLAEIADWDRIKASHDPQVFVAHVQKYPGGLFAELAGVKISRLNAMRAATPWTWIMSGGGMGDASSAGALTAFEEAVKRDSAAQTSADRAEAARLYAQAAEEGLAAAQFSLGRAYDKGRGVERNVDEAARWYKRAADQSHAGAMSALATLYEFGQGVPQNMVEALRLYRLSADAGDVYGLTGLAFLYAEGKGVGRDAEEARRLYSLAVEKGHPRAMFNMALMLLRGQGGAKDTGRAVKLLETAADRGHAAATLELAYLYDEGRGVRKDSKKAAERFLTAVRAKKPAADSLDELMRGWSYTTRREIQRLLKSRGHYEGLAHGFFNAATRKALIASAGP